MLKNRTCRCGSLDAGKTCECSGSDVFVWTRLDDGSTWSRSLSVESTTEREEYLDGEPLPGSPLPFPGLW